MTTPYESAARRACSARGTSARPARTANSTLVSSTPPEEVQSAPSALSPQDKWVIARAVKMAALGYVGRAARLVDTVIRVSTLPTSKVVENLRSPPNEL